METEMTKTEIKIEFSPEELEKFLFWFEDQKYKGLFTTIDSYAHYGTWSFKDKDTRKVTFMSALDLYLKFKEQ